MEVASDFCLSKYPLWYRLQAKQEFPSGRRYTGPSHLMSNGIKVDIHKTQTTQRVSKWSVSLTLTHTVLAQVLE